MNKKRTFAYILLSIATSMMVFTGVSFAWFFNTTADIVPNPTGEVITWSFTEEYFDKLLDEMEQEYKRLYCTYYDIPIIYYCGKII